MPDFFGVAASRVLFCRNHGILSAKKENRTMTGENDKPPLMSSPVAAGFPSPAEQYVESPLDLNELLVHRPAATFFVRAAGDSMTGAGIRSGDILVVDRSLHAGRGRSSSPVSITSSRSNSCGLTANSGILRPPTGNTNRSPSPRGWNSKSSVS